MTISITINARTLDESGDQFGADFSMSSGDAVNVVFSLYANDPVNLTGAQIYWEADEQFFGVVGSPVISKSLGAGIAVESGDIVVVSLTQTDTSGLSGNFAHQLLIYDASGNQSTIPGTMTISNAKAYPLSTIPTPAPTPQCEEGFSDGYDHE